SAPPAPAAVAPPALVSPPPPPVEPGAPPVAPLLSPACWPCAPACASSGPAWKAAPHALASRLARRIAPQLIPSFRSVATVALLRQEASPRQLRPSAAVGRCRYERHFQAHGPAPVRRDRSNSGQVGPGHGPGPRLPPLHPA
ncbi:MAG: hypothetical protein EOO73_36075, partial [Myxococcales bacterium]